MASSSRKELLCHVCVMFVSCLCHGCWCSWLLAGPLAELVALRLLHGVWLSLELADDGQEVVVAALPALAVAVAVASCQCASQE